LVSAFPLPTLTTSDGSIELLSPRLLALIRALQMVEHILEASEAGSVTIHYHRAQVKVIPAPIIEIKEAA
jgi:hypothetical protein